MYKNYARFILVSALTMSVVSILGAQSAPPKPATPAGKPGELVVVEFGQYSTKDPATEFRPHWTLVKQTTDITVQDGAGFGLRFSVFGPFDAKSEPRVKVTLKGAFGGAGGPIGYGFEMGCTMGKGKCVGEFIFSIVRPVQFGGFEKLTAGSYSMYLEYKGATVEKTFVLQ